MPTSNKLSYVPEKASTIMAFKPLMVQQCSPGQKSRSVHLSFTVEWTGEMTKARAHRVAKILCDDLAKQFSGRKMRGHVAAVVAAP